MKKHNEWQNSQFCWFCQFCKFCHFCQFCRTQTQTPIGTRPHTQGHTQDRQHNSVLLGRSRRSQSVTGRAPPRTGRSILRPTNCYALLGRSKGTPNCCWEQDCNLLSSSPLTPLPPCRLELAQGRSPRSSCCTNSVVDTHRCQGDLVDCVGSTRMTQKNHMHTHIS